MTEGQKLLLMKIRPLHMMADRKQVGGCSRVLSKAAMIWNRLPLSMGILLFLASVSMCHAADVILIHGSKTTNYAEEKTIHKLVDYYGLNLFTTDLSFPSALDSIVKRLRSSNTVAVLIRHDSLFALDLQQVRDSLRRQNRSDIPMLVYGISSSIDVGQLKHWSDGVIQQCVQISSDYSPQVLRVGTAGVLARTLAGIDLPPTTRPLCSLRFGSGSKIQTVLAMRRDDGTEEAVLVKNKEAEIFFAPEMVPLDISWHGNAWDLSMAFSSMAPLIMFLSYSRGDYGWHSDGQYANLTIDDPWLTQPYGYLDYPALLFEMEKHNFHTTIAFIPWNFDRSDPIIASLFCTYGQKLSIAMHGNDHQHREFGDYAKNSLENQIGDIKQGVARMEKFHALTGISYDRLMVFPHGIAPEETLAALNLYGFLGTVNSSNVPFGIAYPTDPVFLLRPFTAAYAKFLSLSRYSAGKIVPIQEIAIQAFLGNPILFSSHHTLFQKGSNAFNAIADYVNKVQPETQWVSIGEIARHSHLIRLREDGAWDVLMFSNEMHLRNPKDEDVVYYIRRDEKFSAVPYLMVDGVYVAYERADNVLTKSLIIPPHQTRKVGVIYHNDLDIPHIDINKTNFNAYMLRLVSDFRDLYLSRSSWGYALTQAYYDNGWDSIQRSVESKWWVVTTCAVLVYGGLRYRRRRYPNVKKAS
jgi:hypothetical protein